MEDSRDPSKDPESDVYPEVYGRSVIWHYFRGSLSYTCMALAFYDSVGSACSASDHWLLLELTKVDGDRRYESAHRRAPRVSGHETDWQQR